eukprot:scpid102407/ scgid2435/ 
MVCVRSIGHACTAYCMTSAGTLSAWCVWSMLGIYPLTGTTQYIVGSPSITMATITLDNSNTVTIVAHNNSKENVYVSSSNVGPFLKHEGGFANFALTCVLHEG